MLKSLLQTHHIEEVIFKFFFLYPQIGDSVQLSYLLEMREDFLDFSWICKVEMDAVLVRQNPPKNLNGP